MSNLFSAIVACDENNAIGVNNTLPWHLPNDLKHFKALTVGKTIVMGRRTMQSIGKCLPNRTTYVLTRQGIDEYLGAPTIASLEALPRSSENEEILIVGGAEIYQAFLHMCNRLYLTRVHTHLPNADAYFPDISSLGWTMISSEKHLADEKHPFDFSFQEFVRATP